MHTFTHALSYIMCAEFVGFYIKSRKVMCFCEYEGSVSPVKSLDLYKSCYALEKGQKTKRKRFQKRYELVKLVLQ